MTLEQQVCSLESAKRLKELGVKQESLFVWIDVTDNYNVKPELCKKHPNQQDKKGTYGGNGFKHEGEWEQKYYSAFTVAELDQYLMKTGYAVIAQHDVFWVFKQVDGSTLNYTMMGGDKMLPHENGAERRATLLAYLLENKLITL